MSRKDSLRLVDFLQHILEAIDNIADYTADMDAMAFKADPKTRDAVIRNFEIVGEACNSVVKLDPEFATAHAEMPWRFAYEMRNSLSHGYFAVDLDIVWRTAQENLPPLRTLVEKMLNESLA